RAPVGTSAIALAPYLIPPLFVLVVPATPGIYTLSLHDALPISQGGKPVDRASVVVRFVEGHSIVKLGKAVRTTYELRTNQEGERSEEHTSELQSPDHLVCRLLLEKKKLQQTTKKKRRGRIRYTC